MGMALQRGPRPSPLPIQASQNSFMYPTRRICLYSDIRERKDLRT